MGGLLATMPARPAAVLAAGVGGATWTPASSVTQALPSGLLVPDDSLVFETEASWTPAQVEGLGRYVADGLRYTHEGNDRSGRLSATGGWGPTPAAPAFARADDDDDGRWEEAEITIGGDLPQAGQTYTTLVQFTRWHGKAT